MATGVRSRYHVAINSKGFMLRGAPMSPRYIKEQAPSQISQLGLNDVTNATLNGSGWSYWTQTDWSGGFQKLQWKDDGSFKDGQAVDLITKYGQITLQNGFTSAVSISGSHSYGAHAVHENTLLLGTVKSGAAKLFKLTSANVLSTISAMTGISAVNSITRYQNYSIAGMTRTSGTIKTLSRWNGTALSGFRSSASIVRAVKGIGIRLYFSEYVGSLSGDQLLYSATLSAFTSAYNAGRNRKIKKVEDLNGTPYFFVEDNPSLELFRYDETNEKAYPVYKWDNLTNYGVTRFLSLLVITGSSNNKKVAYAFNGAKLWQIFNDQLSDSSYDFSKPFVFDQNLQTKGGTWDGQFWFPGIYGKYTSVQYTPFSNFNNKAYAYAPTGTLLKVAYQDTTKYAISGHVISSEFGAHIGGVDKLLNAVNINTKTLTSGQTIEVSRSTDGGSSFTSIGTLSYATDGAISKKNLYFPSGFVSKLWSYKIQLVGGGANTPTVNDITFEYRPMADTKRRWALSIDSGDNIQLLNRQKEQRDGKAIMGELWLEKEAKRTVVFEDVDAFEVNLVSAMTAANTSARVNHVRLMPPKGRMRVLKSNVIEEMIYASANGNKIAGITRAQKGTLARSYTSADKIDNYYSVIVTDIKEQINDTDQKTTESVAQVTLLEV